ASRRFIDEQSRHDHRWGVWLLIVSDGAPTDGSPEDILTLVDDMESCGVTVVSCFVAAADIVAHRRLFAAPLPGWSAEAELMFNCASMIDESSALRDYFKEIGWAVDSDGRLFAQANHSELLGELIGALSRIADDRAAAPPAAPAQPPPAMPAARGVDV